MIYVTGDTHGDITRFKQKEIKKLKKGDTLIVCGDFGFIWDGSKKETKMLKWLSKQKYQILFVDGCNENYQLLEKYETSEWNGGQVQIIADGIIHLLRGEIYQIEGKSIFTFGGGDAAQLIDLPEEFSTQGREQPTVKETSNGLENLQAHQNKVDIIITHDAPTKITQAMNVEENGISFIQNYLDVIRKQATFKAWYYGKYHKNKIIPPYYYNVFTDVLKIE